MIQRSAASSSRWARSTVGEVRRARLLLALEEELDVDAGRAAGAAQRVEGGQERHDAGLVVRGAAGVEAPGRIERPAGRASRVARRRPRARRAARGSNGIELHSAGVDRLAVVVGVEDDRPLGAGDGPFAVDRGGACGSAAESSRGFIPWRSSIAEPAPPPCAAAPPDRPQRWGRPESLGTPPARRGEFGPSPARRPAVRKRSRTT